MPISQKRRRAIIAAHSGVCHYCGMEGARTVDHIVPPSLGGSDLLGNLTAACIHCNCAKGNRRLPPETEAAALAEADRMALEILALGERARKPRPPNAGMSKHDVLMPPVVWQDVQAFWRTKPMGTSLSAALRELIERGLSAA
jgi:hypothetical protein